MIEIDLMPEKVKEKKKIPFGQILQTKFIFVVLGCLILFHLFLATIIIINKMWLRNLEKKWLTLVLKKESVDQLERELANIDQRIPLIEQLISRRVLWSKKMNRINDLLISGIWLNEITLQKQKSVAKPRQKRSAVKPKAKAAKYLIIRGSSSSYSKDEPALIGRLMQNLKDDHSFSVDFSEIELGPIKKRQILQTEIMDFNLICKFKQDVLNED